MLPQVKRQHSLRFVLPLAVVGLGTGGSVALAQGLNTSLDGRHHALAIYVGLYGVASLFLSAALALWLYGHSRPQRESERDRARRALKDLLGRELHAAHELLGRDAAMDEALEWGQQRATALIAAALGDGEAHLFGTNPSWVIADPEEPNWEARHYITCRIRRLEDLIERRLDRLSARDGFKPNVWASPEAGAHLEGTRELQRQLGDLPKTDPLSKVLADRLAELYDEGLAILQEVERPSVTDPVRYAEHTLRSNVHTWASATKARKWDQRVRDEFRQNASRFFPVWDAAARALPPETTPTGIPTLYIRDGQIAGFMRPKLAYLRRTITDVQEGR